LLDGYKKDFSHCKAEHARTIMWKERKFSG
jgi:hypothetical protein